MTQGGKALFRVAQTFLVMALVFWIQIAQAQTASITTNSNVSCNGDSDGQLTASTTGGTSPYTYAWSNSSSTASISGLSAATYTVTVTDALGATSTNSAAITEPALLRWSQVSQYSVSCAGGSDGSLTATFAGGTTPYSYLWTNSTTSRTASNLSAGSYKVTCTDANGCTASTYSTSVTEPTALSASISTTHPSSNGGSDGALAASVSGATSPYTYAWSTSSTSSSISSLSAGTYTLTVADKNGCTASITGTVIDPPALTMSTHDNISCNGNSDGKLIITASSGTSPYTYAWSNSSSSTTISNLSAGTYTVTVSDAAGTSATKSATITEPALLRWSQVRQYSVSCAGGSDGSLKATFAGGTTPYSYLWTNSTTSRTASNLSAGSYKVTCTDANGCTASTYSTSVTEPTALSASISTNSNVGCNGSIDGQLTASGLGGTTAYTYSWSNGATSASASSLSAGTYTITITDANGCTATNNKTVTQPTAIGASISSQTNLTCNGVSTGAATAAGSGGTSPYTYAWNTGATSASISSKAAGTYTVSVTDANGCGPATTTVTLTQPTALSASISSQTNLTCYGVSTGAATAAGSGGTSPYTYSWNSGETSASISSKAAGTYTVSITNNNGCGPATTTVTLTQPTAISASISSQTNVSCNGNSSGAATAAGSGGTSPYTYAWSSGETSASISSKAAGTYTVSITDNNGCGPATNTVTLTQPTALSSSITTNSNIGCNGGIDGQLTASGSGGTTAYTYSWSNGATSASASSLYAGTYTITITDANGCTATNNKTVTQPTAIGASISSQTNLNCNGVSTGAATAAGSGGTSPYTYAWNTGATSASISSKAAGTYTVSVTDANGCGPATTTVTLTQPTALSASISSQTNLTCYGVSTGAATAAGSGGTSPYTYSWNSGETSASISSKAAGTYTVSITDNNGCGPATTTVTLTQPTVLSVSITTNSSISSPGASDGQLTASGSGGTTNYSYAWSNSASTASISSLLAGTYTVTLTDANSCTATASVTLSDPVAPEIAVFGNSVEIADGDVTSSIKDHSYFGSVEVTSTTKTRTFTISNTGNTDLTLSGSPKVAVSGTNSGDFTVTSQPSSSSIAASSSLTFVVEFDPSAEGTREATLTISNDDSDEGTYDFAISGLGSNKADYPFEWIWKGGTSTKDASGVYGTKGTASSSNIPGGRRNSVSWKDGSGNVYLFGGYGLDKNGNEGYLNDLWKYDGSQWTWLSGSDTKDETGTYGTKGTGASSNTPGGRFGSIGYADGSDNLWLFGGQGYPGSGSAGNMNDIWKWDGTNWTWVGGDNSINENSNYGTTGQYSSSSWPRGAHESVSWYDGNGIFWMLGGYGRDNNNQGGQLNDLWKWNGSQWAFVGGSKTRKPAGKYGTKGTASSTNWPGGRRYGGSWVDENDDLWLFGGHGGDKTTTNGYLNDLWKYDVSTGNWTWVDGDDDRNQSGTYGAQGESATGNVPGGRRRCSFWKDGSGNMTIYGGYGYDASGNLGELNDMWVWDGSNWAWTSGEKSYQEPGNFGTLSTSSSDNYPGAKYSAVSWIDDNGNLWTMGGEGVDANGDQGYTNDLWKIDMAYIWDGSSSTWSTNGNWKNGGVANSNYPVRIPSGLSTYPTLTANTTLCDIEIEDGASLSIGNGNTLTITSTFKHGGSTTLNLGDGTLKLNGTSAQTIDGKINGNVEIDNSSDVTLGAESTIGTLTLTNGDLDIGNNNLSLGSATGGSSTSYIKISGTGSVTTEVGSSPVTIPVGRNPYEPIIIDDGGGADYTVAVFDNVYDNPETQSGQKNTFVVGETWTIQASTAQNNVSVTLQWDQAEEETNFDRTSCMVGYWENGVSTEWNSQGTNAAASGSDPYTQTRTIDFTTNLFYFGVGSSGSALPVELAYFTAHWHEQGKIAQLSWQTAIEENNSHFEIERSFDGQVWQQIGRLEGAGNSIASIDYTYIDKSPSLAEGRVGMGQTIYYCLKQVDYNDAYEYSLVRSLNFKLETLNFSFYPNPTSNWINVETTISIQSLRVYNLQGILVKESSESNRINLESLLPGQYILEITTDQNTTRKKIMVN